MPAACVFLLAAGLCLAQDQTAAPDTSPAPTPVDPAPAAYSPPPHKSIFKRLFSSQALVATVPGAVLQQVHDWPDEWGKKRLGFEKRVGSMYAQFAVGMLIADGVKAIHPEDTRYRRDGEGIFFKRFAHVVTGTVVARKTDGSLTPAWSLPAYAYGSWALATLWSPHEYRNAASIFEWGSAGLAVAPLANFVKEFWPDVRGILHKK